VLEVRVARSIHEVGRGAWDACFEGRLEAYDYLAAVEAAALPGFEQRYVAVVRAGRVLAAAPIFITDYPLDTTLNGARRRLVRELRRIAPRALTLRLACLGSPCTEDVGAGFAPQATPAHRAHLLTALTAAFEREAAQAGCWLLGVKDAPEPQAELWRALADQRGYQAVPGLPGAELAIDFADMDGYLARLSPGVRRDMRRKLRTLERLRIAISDDLGGLEGRVLELYRQTRARSELQFEELNEAYFTGVLRAMPGRAFCVLYFADDELIGVNLLLQDGETLLDKFFCMESVRGPAHSLWFISWFTNVRLCLERGLRLYRSGQGAYADKLRLGCRLVGAQMYYRHRRPLFDRALKWAAPRLADDPVGSACGR